MRVPARKFSVVAEGPIIAQVYLIAILLIALLSYLPTLRESILALLGNITLELLLFAAGANFTGWLFVHASYYDKVKQVHNEEMMRIRTGMRGLRSSPETELADYQIDQWVEWISGYYTWLNKFDRRLGNGLQYFLWGTIIAIAGAFTELFPALPANLDFVGLVISAVLLVLGIDQTNLLMKDLSRRT
jgi:hypothetical protein